MIPRTTAPVAVFTAAHALALSAMAALAAPAAAQELSPSEIAARVRPAVVSVTALADGEEISEGSGFIVSSEGHFVTNRHVIEGADRLQVRMATGEIYDQVYFVTGDERRDLAILRIPATGLTPLAIGDDRAVEVGDHVYAMGNPLGLEGTFSDGLVSAKRTVDGVALIQISAPISPGSSGGPVLNSAGEVIGVATLTFRAGQNLNMAVPARYAEGLLSTDEEPQRFSLVADRFATESSSNPAAAALESDDLEPWAEVLVSEMEAVAQAADEIGLVAIRDPVVDMIDQGETYTIDFTFEERETITLAGVCDLDCGDLDMAVHDGHGRTIVSDVELDDRPVAAFDVLRPGRFEVVVYMATCTREPCGFAVQTFAKGQGLIAVSRLKPCPDVDRRQPHRPRPTARPDPRAQPGLLAGSRGRMRDEPSAEV